MVLIGKKFASCRYLSRKLKLIRLNNFTSCSNIVSFLDRGKRRNKTYCCKTIFQLCKLYRYGNKLIKKKSLGNELPDIFRLFQIVPYKTALPLLAYTIFSVIKYFLPMYPGRLSKKEPYYKVKSKQKKRFFVSLCGDHASYVANAFCDSFTDYENTEVNRLLLQKRVHDGIVVYDNEFTSLKRFLDYTFIQDACVLCVNPKFKLSPQELRIETDITLSDEEFTEIRAIVEHLLLGVAEYIILRYEKEKTIIIQNHIELLWDEYAKLYEKSIRLLSHPDTVSEHLISHQLLKIKRNFPIITDKEQQHTWELSTQLENSLLEVLEDIVKAHDGIYQFSQKRATIKVNHIRKFKASVKPPIKLSQQKFEANLFRSLNLEKPPIDANDYLCLATQFLCKYLQDKGMEDDKIQLLKNMSSEVFQKIALPLKNEINPDKILNNFISTACLQKKIIRNRTERKHNTLGWFDPQKELIYLPYKTYFNSISSYYKNTFSSDFLYKPKEFQDALAEKDIILLKKSGQSSYHRADFKVVVNSIDDSSSAETVIKINVTRLALTEEAKNYLQELSQLNVPRRKPSK